MLRNQIENIYLYYGLNDLQLTTHDDLLKIHGVNWQEVPGYSRLDDVNRKLYEKFILNFFNANGLESRTQLVLTGIYFVEEVEELIKDRQEEEFFTVAGVHVYSIDRNGVKSVLHSERFKGYENSIILEKPTKNYLRFEYQTYGREGWLHVINEKEWY